ncbi:MAG: cupin domain-containing protein [Ruminococcaceae bacterium]|nr:cupin domain-containing protein [Oscillospiraceae bacterium]
MKTPYVKTQLSSIVNITKIVTIHYYEFDKNFVFNGEKHDFWELVYVDKGRVEVQYDEEKITLSQGEIIFHQPNEFHSIIA